VLYKKLRTYFLCIKLNKVFLQNQRLKIELMKKILFLAVVLVNASIFAQSGAKIEFKDKDNTIDYGTVNKEDDNGIRSFEFTNTGDAPLIITNVQSTCGCTVPSKPTEPILPGKTGKIDVKYNMNTGPIRKTITVESNAVNYENGRVALKIKGEVVVKKEVNIMEKKKTSPMLQ
jgi:hypothetical protein